MTGTRWRLFGVFWRPMFLPLGSLIVGLMLLVTLVLDHRRGPRRDWLHWVGVAIVATGVLVSVGVWVWWMFAGPIRMSS